VLVAQIAIFLQRFVDHVFQLEGSKIPCLCLNKFMRGRPIEAAQLYAGCKSWQNLRIHSSCSGSRPTNSHPCSNPIRCLTTARIAIGSGMSGIESSTETISPTASSLVVTAPSPASASSKHRPWTRTYPCLPSTRRTSGNSVRYRTNRRADDLQVRRKLGRPAPFSFPESSRGCGLAADGF